MKKIFVLSLLASPLFAADIIKSNNGDPYDSGLCWEGGVAPGPDDIAVWNALLSISNPRSRLVVDTHWKGVRVASDAAQSAFISKTADSAPEEPVLTLGSEGIKILSTARGFNFSTNLRLSASQTWTTTGTSGASGISHLSASKLGNEAFVDFGGHTVTKEGPAPVGFSTNTNGHCTLKNGTLVINAGELSVSSANQATINTPVPYMRVSSDFTIRMNGTSVLRGFNRHAAVENLDWKARVELNGGTFQICGFQSILGDGRSWPSTIGGQVHVLANSILEIPAAINNLTAEHKLTAPITGGGVTLALRNLSAAAAPANHSMVLIGDNSGFSGSFAIDAASGKRTVRLRGPQSGSAAAAWTITTGNTLEMEDSVSLGSLAGAGSLTTVGNRAVVASIGARGSSVFTGPVTNAATAPLALRKVGTGTLTLTGALSHTGDTLVESGTLTLSTAGLNDSSLVRITTGGVLRLNHTLTDQVAQLYLNGVPQPPGTYGAPGGTAANQSTHFAGNGVLEVTGAALTPYAAWAGGFLELTSALARAPDADPDGDGVNNRGEYAFDSNPTSPAPGGKIFEVPAPGGEIYFVLPVRTGAIFTPAGNELVSATFEGVSYRIQASTDLVNFPGVPLTEVTPFTPPPAPALSSPNWSYRAFRGPSGSQRLFFRALAGE